MESIRHHGPDGLETLFIFLGAGVALMIGLATELFTPFLRLGMAVGQVNDVKATMIVLGWAWSTWLAWRCVEAPGTNYNPIECNSRCLWWCFHESAGT